MAKYNMLLNTSCGVSFPSDAKRMSLYGLMARRDYFNVIRSLAYGEHDMFSNTKEARFGLHGANGTFLLPRPSQPRNVLANHQPRSLNS